MDEDPATQHKDRCFEVFRVECNIIQASPVEYSSKKFQIRFLDVAQPKRFSFGTGRETEGGGRPQTARIPKSWHPPVVGPFFLLWFVDSALR